MRKIGIIGAALAAAGSLIAGTSLITGSPTFRHSSRDIRPPAYASAKVRRAMRSRYQPHDGAKQIEKDRRRGYWMDGWYDAIFTDAHGWVAEKRAAPIVCGGSKRP